MKQKRKETSLLSGKTGRAFLVCLSFVLGWALCLWALSLLMGTEGSLWTVWAADIAGNTQSKPSYKWLDDKVEVLYNLSFMWEKDNVSSEVVNASMEDEGSLYITGNQVIVKPVGLLGGTVWGSNVVWDWVDANILWWENNLVNANNVTLVAWDNNKIQEWSDNSTVLWWLNNSIGMDEYYYMKKDENSILLWWESSYLSGIGLNAIIGWSWNTLENVIGVTLLWWWWNVAKFLGEGIVWGRMIEVDQWPWGLREIFVFSDGHEAYMNESNKFSPEDPYAFYLDVRQGLWLDTQASRWWVESKWAVGLWIMDVTQTCNEKNYWVQWMWNGCLVWCTKESRDQWWKWEMLDRGDICSTICDYKKWDFNRDWTVDISDSIRFNDKCYKSILGQYSLNSLEAQQCDMNGDWIIDISDYYGFDNILRRGDYRGIVDNCDKIVFPEWGTNPVWEEPAECTPIELKDRATLCNSSLLGSYKNVIFESSMVDNGYCTDDKPCIYQCKDGYHMVDGRCYQDCMLKDNEGHNLWDSSIKHNEIKSWEHGNYQCYDGTLKFACEANYHTEDGRTCISNFRDTQCSASSQPANSVITKWQYAQEWKSWEWWTPSTIEWTFDESGQTECGYKCENGFAYVEGKWCLKEYTVMFDCTTNGWNLELTTSPTEVKLPVGTEISFGTNEITLPNGETNTLSVPTCKRDCYTMVWWYTRANSHNYSTKYTIKSTDANGNDQIKLYATYEGNPNKPSTCNSYLIAYLSGYNGVDHPDVTTWCVLYNTEESCQVSMLYGLNRTWWDFLWWNTDRTAAESHEAFDKTTNLLTLKAELNRKFWYTITKKEVSIDFIVNPEDKANFVDNKVELSDLGWCTQKSEDGMKLTCSCNVYSLDSYCMVWKGGNVSIKAPWAKQVKDGWVFLGWSHNWDTWVDYEKWNSVKVYTDGTKSKEYLVVSNECDVNETTVKYDCSTNGWQWEKTLPYVWKWEELIWRAPNCTAPDGYEFVWWNVDKTAHEWLETYSLQCPDPKTPVSLYAIYKKTITVTFNENNSTFEWESSPVTRTCDIYNKEGYCVVNPPKVVPNENTPIFVGWNKSPDATERYSGYDDFDGKNDLMLSSSDDNSTWYAITKSREITVEVNFKVYEIRNGKVTFSAVLPMKTDQVIVQWFNGESPLEKKVSIVAPEFVSPRQSDGYQTVWWTASLMAIEKNLLSFNTEGYVRLVDETEWNLQICVDGEYTACYKETWSAWQIKATRVIDTDQKAKYSIDLYALDQKELKATIYPDRWHMSNSEAVSCMLMKNKEECVVDLKNKIVTTSSKWVEYQPIGWNSSSSATTNDDTDHIRRADYSENSYKLYLKSDVQNSKWYAVVKKPNAYTLKFTSNPNGLCSLQEKSWSCDLYNAGTACEVDMNQPSLDDVTVQKGYINVWWSQNSNTSWDSQSLNFRISKDTTYYCIAVDWSKPTITITQDDSGICKTSKTVSASTNEWTLSMSEWTSTTCDETRTFSAYTSKTYSSESDNGKYICYKAVDSVWNTTYQLSEKIDKIDTTAPVLTNQTKYQNIWYNEEQTSTFTYKDACTWEEKQESCKISVDWEASTCTINKQVCDNIGNCSTISATSNAIKLDTVAPNIEIKPNPDSTPAKYKEVWAVVSDKTSWVKNIRYVITESTTCAVGTATADNPWKLYKNSEKMKLSWKEDNGKYVCFKAEDNAWKVYYQRSNKIELKLDWPTITISGPEAWWATSKKVSATVSEWTLYMSEWTSTTCDSSRTFTTYAAKTYSSESDNGKYICYKAVDNVWNTTYKLSDRIDKIDKTAPTCTNGWDNTNWTKEDRTISYGCKDDQSWCDSNYAWGSSKFTTTTETATIAAYTIKDNVWNTTTCQARTAKVYVDKTAPECELLLSKSSLKVGESDTLTVVCTDKHSWITTTSVNLEAIENRNSTVASLTNKGMNTFTYTALNPWTTTFKLLAWKVSDNVWNQNTDVSSILQVKQADVILCQGCPDGKDHKPWETCTTKYGSKCNKVSTCQSDWTWDPKLWGACSCAKAWACRETPHGWTCTTYQYNSGENVCKDGCKATVSTCVNGVWDKQPYDYSYCGCCTVYPEDGDTRYLAQGETLNGYSQWECGDQGAKACSDFKLSLTCNNGKLLDNNKKEYYTIYMWCSCLWVCGDWLVISSRNRWWDSWPGDIHVNKFYTNETYCMRWDKIDLKTSGQKASRDDNNLRRNMVSHVSADPTRPDGPSDWILATWTCDGWAVSLTSGRENYYSSWCMACDLNAWYILMWSNASSTGVGKIKDCLQAKCRWGQYRNDSWNKVYSSWEWASEGCHRDTKTQNCELNDNMKNQWYRCWAEWDYHDFPSSVAPWSPTAVVKFNGIQGKEDTYKGLHPGEHYIDLTQWWY